MLQQNNPYYSYQRPLRRGGCLPVLIFLALLIGDCWLVYQYLLTDPAPVALLGQFFASCTFTVVGIAGLVLLAILIILTNTFSHTFMGKLLSRLTGIVSAQTNNANL